MTHSIETIIPAPAGTTHADTGPDPLVRRPPSTLDRLLAPIRNNGGVILALLALYLIWGSTYLRIRLAIESFPPFLMAAVRFLVAGTSLFVFLRTRGTPMPTRAQWIGSALVGVLLLGGGNGGVSFAEQWVSSGLT